MRWFQFNCQQVTTTTQLAAESSELIDTDRLKLGQGPVTGQSYVPTLSSESSLVNGNIQLHNLTDQFIVFYELNVYLACTDEQERCDVVEQQYERKTVNGWSGGQVSGLLIGSCHDVATLPCVTNPFRFLTSAYKRQKLVGVMSMDVHVTQDYVRWEWNILFLQESLITDYQFIIILRRGNGTPHPS